MGSSHAHGGVPQLQQAKSLRVVAKWNIFIRRLDKLRVIRFGGGRCDHQFNSLWNLRRITNGNIKALGLQ